MRCEACQGCGWILVSMVNLDWSVCPECDGQGSQHCCEGLREQPSENEAES
jgi:excinuclease UvrABC ATPase subunit